MKVERVDWKDKKNPRITLKPNEGDKPFSYEAGGVPLYGHTLEISVSKDVDLEDAKSLLYDRGRTPDIIDGWLPIQEGTEGVRVVAKGVRALLYPEDLPPVVVSSIVEVVLAEQPTAVS